MSREAAPIRLSLRTKLVALVVLVSTVPLLIAMGLSSARAKDALELASKQLAVAVASDVARTLDETCEVGERDLRAIARTLGDPQIAEELRLRVAMTTLESATSLDSVTVYDRRGETIDTLLHGARFAMPGTLRAETRAEATRAGVALLDVRRDGTARALLVVPIGEGDPTGFVASYVSLAVVDDRVHELAEARLGSGARLAVVDASGLVIADSDDDGAPLDGHPLLASRARDVARSTDYEAGGRGYLGTLVELRDRPFGVLCVQSREVAYASVSAMERTSIAIALATLVVALLLALLLARQLTAPIAQLVAFARDLAARKFDTRVAVKTGDELEVLGTAMTRAAIDLQASDVRLREEATIRADLGRYLPEGLVEKIVRREQDMELGGRRAQVTVLFADVVAFTPLSERFPPEQVVSMLNELFTILTDVVFKHGGMVDKLIGDCVMALFGAPEPQADHVRAALGAAEDMMRFLEPLNRAFEAKYGTRVRLAIGIHTGEVIVGNLGSDRRMDYTAIGDVVNVAARLEAIARPQQILVTAAVRDAAGDAFTFAPLGPHTLEGRAAPLELFEVRS